MYATPEAYEQALDRLVDQGRLSYDDARRQLGPEPTAELPSQRLSSDELSALGAFMCADCADMILPGKSCGHVSIALDGTRKILR